MYFATTLEKLSKKGALGLRKAEKTWRSLKLSSTSAKLSKALNVLSKTLLVSPLNRKPAKRSRVELTRREMLASLSAHALTAAFAESPTLV